MKLLKFNIRGDWAHFRKPFSNIARLTYKVPPRMTVAGMLAGILGLERDSYYDIFSGDGYDYSVVPNGAIRTKRVPQNMLGTADENMIKFNNSGKGPSLNLVDPTDSRKRRMIHYVVKPDYDLYLRLDSELEDKIYERMNDCLYEYTPCLGTAKCIADVSEPSIVSASRVSDEKVEVDSPITDSKSISDMNSTSISSEKITYSFKMSEGSRGLDRRKSERFISYIVETSGSPLFVDVESHNGVGTIYHIEDDGNTIELY